MLSSVVRFFRTGCVLGVFSLFAALTPPFGHAQVARIELHVLQSTTLTDQEFLFGQIERSSMAGSDTSEFTWTTGGEQC